MLTKPFNEAKATLTPKTDKNNTHTHKKKKIKANVTVERRCKDPQKRY